MRFIHGEARWDVGRGPLAADVTAMSRAANSSLHPELREVHDDRGACALLTQTTDGVREETDATSNESASVVVVHDLRIHDTASLCLALGCTSRDLRGVSISEVLRRLYRLHGTRGFDHLVAEGTLAIWDRRDGSLLLWRDVAGTRPLYYHHQPGCRLVFSSDLRAMAAHPNVPRVLDLEFARSALEIGHPFCHPTRTLRQGVLKLPAGHFLVAGRSSFHVASYWRPEDVAERTHRNPEDFALELRDLLELAVKSRLQDEPGKVASHLTGGLDSSTIAVLAHRNLSAGHQPLTGISWAPPRDVIESVEFDERPLVEAVARASGLQLQFTTVDPRERAGIQSCDQSLMPVTTLASERSASRIAAENGITTVLSGWGGDELAAFNGRGFFADLARKGRWLTLSRELRLQRSRIGIPALGALRGRVIVPMLPDSVLRMVRPQYLVRRSLPATLLPDFRAALERVEPLEYQSVRVRPGGRRMQRTLFTAGHLQLRAESWAAHGADVGISYSYPLLDRRLVEFALSIPDDLYFRDGWKRWIFREAAAGVLPDEVRWNLHKIDVAAAAELRRVSSDTRRLVRDALLERRSNPYLDIDEVMSPTSHAAKSDFDDPQRSPLWIAFVDLPMP